MSEIVRIAVHSKTGRPACVLMQAVMGGDRHFIGQNIPTEWWEVGDPTGMRLFAFPIEKLDSYKRFCAKQAKAGWPEVMGL